MTQMWTIVSSANATTVVETLFITDSFGQHPKDKGFAWDAAAMTAKRIDTRPDPALQVWTGSAWADDAGKIEALLIGRVKAEAEARRMLVMSPGGSKKTVYSLKQAEVERWNGLATTLVTALAAFVGLTPVEQLRKFRFALADAKRRGEANPAAAIARFQTGADASNAEAARIEAIEQAGVAALKAAVTAAAKRAAFAAINWTWAP